MVTKKMSLEDARRHTSKVRAQFKSDWKNMAPNMATLLFGVENMLKEILHDISERYEIAYTDLEERYLMPQEGDENSEFTSPPPKPKVVAKPRVKKAKEGDEEKVQCKGLTTKKTQCKKFALAGGVFCACHQKKADEGDDPSEVKAKPKATKGKAKPKREKVEEDEVTSPPPKKKGITSPPPAPKKKVHNHKIDGEEHEECEMCAEQGNAGEMQSPKYTVAESARTRLKNILAAVQMENEESGSETDDE